MVGMILGITLGMAGGIHTTMVITAGDIPITIMAEAAAVTIMAIPVTLVL